MNRVVFRAWHYNRKQMYGVVLIDFDTGKVVLKEGVIHFGESVGMVELMQFSGKTDTLGKMIFEGDVCMYKGKRGIVIKDKDRWSLQYKEALMEQELPLPMISGKDLKVIGNTWEGAEEEE